MELSILLSLLLLPIITYSITIPIYITPVTEREPKVISGLYQNPPKSKT